MPTFVQRGFSEKPQPRECETPGSKRPYQASGRALQQVAIGVFVEADVERVALLDGGGAEVAGGAEQVGGQFVVVGGVLGQIEGDDLFALGDMDDTGRLRERQGRRPIFLVLAGVGVGLDVDLVPLEEPPSLLARDSRLAMVQPIDAVGHEFTPRYGRRQVEAPAEPRTRKDRPLRCD